VLVALVLEKNDTDHAKLNDCIKAYFFSIAYFYGLSAACRVHTVKPTVKKL
jgi:hypothetical protein